MLMNGKKRTGGKKKRATRTIVVHAKPAAHRSKKRNPHTTTKKHRSRNPRMREAVKSLSFTTIVLAGASAAGSAILTRAIPQTLLKEKNKGILGYASNLAVAVGGAFVAHYFTKRKEVFYGVLAGGVAAVIQRVYSEKVSQASVSNMADLGDLEYSRHGVKALGEYLALNNPPLDSRAGKFQLPAAALTQIPSAKQGATISPADTDVPSDRFRGRFQASA